VIQIRKPGFFVVDAEVERISLHYKPRDIGAWNEKAVEVTLCTVSL